MYVTPVLCVTVPNTVSVSVQYVPCVMHKTIHQTNLTRTGMWIQQTQSATRFGNLLNQFEVLVLSNCNFLSIKLHADLASWALTILVLHVSCMTQISIHKTNVTCTEIRVQRTHNPLHVAALTCSRLRVRCIHISVLVMLVCYTELNWQVCYLYVLHVLPICKSRAHTRAWPYSCTYSLSRHWVAWVGSFIFRPLYSWEKSCRCPSNSRLCGTQSPSGRFGQETSLFLLPGRNYCTPDFQTLAIPTDIARLSSVVTNGNSKLSFCR